MIVFCTLSSFGLRGKCLWWRLDLLFIFFFSFNVISSRFFVPSSLFALSFPSSWFYIILSLWTLLSRSSLLSPSHRISSPSLAIFPRPFSLNIVFLIHMLPRLSSSWVLTVFINCHPHHYCYSQLIILFVIFFLLFCLTNPLPSIRHPKLDYTYLYCQLYYILILIAVLAMMTVCLDWSQVILIRTFTHPLLDFFSLPCLWICDDSFRS